MVEAVMTLVAPVSFKVATQRVADYLRASGLPESLVLEWTTELIAVKSKSEPVDLPRLLMITSQRLEAWLAANLALATTDNQSLLALRAELPCWQSQANWSEQFTPWQTKLTQLWATPPPATLPMPTQVITLRSLRRLITTACYHCLPMGQRMLIWLRGL